MTKRQVRQAYREIQLSQQEKDKLLRNILSASGLDAPYGKDSIMKKKTYMPVVIAAVIALMTFLMGCAWAVLHLEDLKIGENISKGQVLDSEGVVIKETEMVRDVISLQGIAGTPNYQAAKEWYDFSENYDPEDSLVFEADNSGYRAPAEYDGYLVYTQEMIDKVDDICYRYGLEPAGVEAVVNRWQVDVMVESLGISSLLKSDVKDVDYAGGYFYSCGNFQMEGSFTLINSEAQWNDMVHFSYRYSDKGYLDTVFWSVDPDSVVQWTYICSDGTEILIVNADDQTRLMCDREDAFITVAFYSEDILSENGITMTVRDMELVAEVFDFSVKTVQPDMNKAEIALEKATQAYESTKPDDVPWGHGEMLKWMIPWRIEQFGNPPQLFYYLYDYDEDGDLDILLGYEDEFTNVWTLNEKGDSVPDYFDESIRQMLSELWLTLDITPVEEFPFDEY